jgi:hypothetical protein
MEATVCTSTGAPSSRRPFTRRLSATPDSLVLQLEANLPCWRRQILRLRKVAVEHRAMGRAG